MKRKRMKRIFSLFLVTCLMAGTTVLSGCSSSFEPISVSGYKLNTYVTITAYSKTSEDVLNGCLDICDTYENMFSMTLSDSTLYKVNHHELTEVPEEFAKVVQYGIDYGDISGGAMDISIGSVSQLWDFNTDDPQVPDATAIADALTTVNYKNIQLTDNQDGTYHIEIPEGMNIDLGAVAKGYIADRIKDYLLENGVTRAIINLGGNVLCVGTKDASNDFTIGVEKPFTETSETVAKLSIDDKSVVSSGNYERYFYQDGTLYYHILDPTTGYPYNCNISEVTIISNESVLGDCLSTTCFVLGVDKGLELIESMDDTEAMFVTTDGQIYYSSGMSAYLKD